MPEQGRYRIIWEMNLSANSPLEALKLALKCLAPEEPYPTGAIWSKNMKTASSSNMKHMTYSNNHYHRVMAKALDKLHQGLIREARAKRQQTNYRNQQDQGDENET